MLMEDSTEREVNGQPLYKSKTVNMAGRIVVLNAVYGQISLSNSACSRMWRVQLSGEPGKWLEGGTAKTYAKAHRKELLAECFAAAQLATNANWQQHTTGRHGDAARIGREACFIAFPELREAYNHAQAEKDLRMLEKGARAGTVGVFKTPEEFHGGRALGKVLTEKGLVDG